MLAEIKKKNNSKYNELPQNDFFDEEDEFEGLSDKEIDDLFRPKKTNSRKSLAPLFVYMILKERTDDLHHLNQKEIAEILKEYPYEIQMERQSLSRVLHNLEDTGFGIICSKRKGCWFDENEIW